MSPESTSLHKQSETTAYNVEAEVKRRYGAGAQQVEAALCCPTEYDDTFLKLIPKEIVEKDYGCGDPSAHVREGETVLDLGSGTGKICYILAQKVGPEGSVIGVDFGDEMLGVARKYKGEMGEKLGYRNVDFHKGRIQDLALDLDRVQGWLATNPVSTVDGVAALETECDRLRTREPMISDNSVDVVVSNCVLNLVRPSDKTQLFNEIFRVLKRGGRAVISDVVCDEMPTGKILNDPDLWSGCIAGAFREDEFLEMFEAAGFYGVEILTRQAEPWQVIDGVEFRSLTVQAFKGKQGPCLERNQAVVYTGPWKTVTDDDNHTYHRGQRMAVCDKTYKILTRPTGPYAASTIGIEPRVEIPLETAGLFACAGSAVRDPRVTKGQDYHETIQTDGPVCDETGCC